MSIAVLICGLPDSGNRLLSDLVTYNGAAEARILHFGDGIEEACREYHSRGHAVRAVIPLRDPAIQWKAVCDTVKQVPDQTAAAMHMRHWTRTLSRLGALGVPTVLVNYEDLVRDPEGWGEGVCEQLGLPFMGWPCEVYDANAKWRGEPDPRETDTNHAEGDTPKVGALSGTARRAR